MVLVADSLCLVSLSAVQYSAVHFNIAVVCDSDNCLEYIYSMYFFRFCLVVCQFIYQSLIKLFQTQNPVVFTCQ